MELFGLQDITWLYRGGGAGQRKKFLSGAEGWEKNSLPKI